MVDFVRVHLCTIPSKKCSGSWTNLDPNLLCLFSYFLKVVMKSVVMGLSEDERGEEREENFNLGLTKSRPQVKYEWEKGEVESVVLFLLMLEGRVYL